MDSTCVNTQTGGGECRGLNLRIYSTCFWSCRECDRSRWQGCIVTTSGQP